MDNQKDRLLREILKEYGTRLGYDSSTFPNKFLRMVADLESTGADIEAVVGIRKFGGRWITIDKNRLVRWLARNVEPGPRYEIASIPENITPDEFLSEARGMFNLRSILSFFDTRTVNFFKVRNAAKRIERSGGSPRKEIGVMMKNELWIVEFPKFGVFLRDNEPELRSDP